MSSIRMQRVGEEIQKVLSSRLLRGLRDPLPGFVTIKDVEVNSDFSLAKVYFSVFGSDEQKREAQRILDASKGMLRTEVGQKVRLRHTPALAFILDESGDRAARVQSLLMGRDPDTAETRSENTQSKNTQNQVDDEEK